MSIDKENRELTKLQEAIARALTKAGFKYFSFMEFDKEIHLESSGYKVIVQFKKLKK